jgi:hypothetical protein
MPSPTQPQLEVRYPDGTQPAEFEGRVFSDLTRLLKLLKEYNEQHVGNIPHPLNDTMIHVVRDQL